MATRGDIGYKDEYDRKFLKVYRQAMLFLPVPFAQRKINQYTVTMEIMFEERPESLLAIFNTALYNEKPANVLSSLLQFIPFGLTFTPNNRSTLALTASLVCGTRSHETMETLCCPTNGTSSA